MAMIMLASVIAFMSVLVNKKYTKHQNIFMPLHCHSHQFAQLSIYMSLYSRGNQNSIATTNQIIHRHDNVRLYHRLTGLRE